MRSSTFNSKMSPQITTIGLSINVETLLIQKAQSNVFDCSDRNYLKYYVVVVQKWVFIDYAVRLAPEETSVNLTGYEHNAVTCIGMKTDILVILDQVIVKLNPDFFWLVAERSIGKL